MNLRTISIIALCLLYVAARSWRLTDSCLWFDEIFSVHAATHSWGEIWNFVALDLIHPPLFYVLLKLWIGAVGETLFWLRLLPVIFSIAAIFPFIALCRELKLSFWTQAFAFFLLAVNGALIKYAQEVRMYSLLMCLSLFSMWLFARFFYRGKSFIVLVIVNVLLVYTHYFGWLLVVSEVVLVLWFERIKWRRMATMFAIALASFLPWAMAVFQAARSGSDLGQNIGWMSRPGIREISVFLLDLIEPFYSQAVSSEPASIYRISIPILLIVIISWIAYLQTWKTRTDDERRTIWLLLIFIKLPVIIAFIASWLLPYSIWGTRHLIIIFAPFSILLAVALGKIQFTWLRTAALTILVLFCVYAFVTQAVRQTAPPIWCGFESIAKEIDKTRQAPIYVFEDLAAYHLWFTYSHAPDRKESPQVVKIDDLEGISEDKAYFLPRGFDDVPKIKFEQLDVAELWIVFRAEQAYADAAPLSEFYVKGYEWVEGRELAAGDTKINAIFLVNHAWGLTKAKALTSLSGNCWNDTRPDCNDFAGFLMELYENGDKSLLVQLVDVGLKSDGARAAHFGMFFGSVLESNPTDLLTELARRPVRQQREICFLAAGGDGGGHGPAWETSVREKLNRITQQPQNSLLPVTRVCLSEIERFQKLNNNRGY